MCSYSVPAVVKETDLGSLLLPSFPRAHVDTVSSDSAGHVRATFTTAMLDDSSFSGKMTLMVKDQQIHALILL